MTSKDLIYRIGAGKAIGLVFGLIGFFSLPLLVQEPGMMLRVGVLLWYPTLGAIIGMFGVFAEHPVIKMPLPWWVRGALFGGWMNLLVALFAHQQLSTIVMAMFGEYAASISIYLMVIEGIIIGMLMDYLLTQWFGEGGVKQLVSDKPA